MDITGDRQKAKLDWNSHTMKGFCGRLGGRFSFPKLDKMDFGVTPYLKPMAGNQVTAKGTCIQCIFLVKTDSLAENRKTQKAKFSLDF